MPQRNGMPSSQFSGCSLNRPALRWSKRPFCTLPSPYTGMSFAAFQRCETFVAV